MSNGSMRAQLSLLFTDKTLYDEFIVPCKNDRRLHSIIMKCLSAYYYNAEARNLIEGSELHKDEEVTEKINSHQDSINNIRDLLAMQGFISKELENTLEDGIDDMTDILDHVNKTAEDFSVVKTTETEYGGKSMKLLSVQTEQSSTKSETVKPVETNTEYSSDIVKMVTQMYTMFSQQPMFKEMFGSDIVTIKGNESQVKESVNINTEQDNMVNVKTDIGDLDVNDFDIASPPTTTNNIEETDSSIEVEDASGALGDLMSSLYG